jgi:hypothetical protein
MGSNAEGVPSLSLAVNPGLDVELMALDISEALQGTGLEVSCNDAGDNIGALTLKLGSSWTLNWWNCQGWTFLSTDMDWGDALVGRITSGQPAQHPLGESRKWRSAMIDISRRRESDLFLYLDPERLAGLLPTGFETLYRDSELRDLISITAAIEIGDGSPIEILEADVSAHMAIPRNGSWLAFEATKPVESVPLLPDEAEYAFFCRVDALVLSELWSSIRESKFAQPIVVSIENEAEKSFGVPVHKLLAAWTGEFANVGVRASKKVAGDFFLLAGCRDYSTMELLGKNLASANHNGLKLELDMYKGIKEWYPRRRDFVRDIERLAEEQGTVARRGRKESENRRSGADDKPVVGVALSRQFFFLGTRERAEEVLLGEFTQLESSHPDIQTVYPAIRDLAEGRSPFVSVFVWKSSLEEWVQSLLWDAERSRQIRAEGRVDMEEYEPGFAPLTQFDHEEDFIRQCVLRILSAFIDDVELVSAEVFDEERNVRAVIGVYRELE